METMASQPIFVWQKNDKKATESSVRLLTGLKAWRDERGHSGITIVLDNRDDQKISIPMDPMIGLFHWKNKGLNEKGQKVLEQTFENATRIWSMSYVEDGKEVKVPKDEVLGTLDRLGAGRKVRICMDSGKFSCTATTYDKNESSEGKLRALVWALSPFLEGITVGKAILGTGVETCIMNAKGEKATAEEIQAAFDACEVTPMIDCRLSVDSFDRLSIVDIKRV